MRKTAATTSVQISGSNGDLFGDETVILWVHKLIRHEACKLGYKYDEDGMHVLIPELHPNLQFQRKHVGMNADMH